MDIALAIAQINPGGEYRLNHSQADGTQKILEWRGPGKQPTQEELKAAWEQYLKEHGDPEIEVLVAQLIQAQTTLDVAEMLVAIEVLTPKEIEDFQTNAHACRQRLVQQRKKKDITL